MTKESKQNIIVMAVVAVVFIIGIILRWDYISKEIGESFGRYFHALDSVPGQIVPEKTAE